MGDEAPALLKKTCQIIKYVGAIPTMTLKVTGRPYTLTIVCGDLSSAHWVTPRSLTAIGTLSMLGGTISLPTSSFPTTSASSI